MATSLVERRSQPTTIVTSAAPCSPRTCGSSRRTFASVVRMIGVAGRGIWMTSGACRTACPNSPIFTPDSGTAEVRSQADAPALQRAGLDLSLVWPDGLRFTLTAIRDGREGVRGELTVTQGVRRLSWGSFLLSSTQARETLRK